MPTFLHSNKRTSLLILIICFLTQHCQYGSAFLKNVENEDCFCGLKGNIDDCQCDVGTVDSFNNVKIYPRLRSLLVKDYFRYFKVNLKKKCPFWVDDGRCSMRYCSVQSCHENEVPIGIKGGARRERKGPNNEDSTTPLLIRSKSRSMCQTMNKQQQTQTSSEKYGTTMINTREYPNQYCQCRISDKTDELNQCGGPNDLDYLNTTLSAKIVKDMELWTAHDFAQENFCILDENDENSEYVDLLLNPERYTGYRGKSAARVWRSIYTENCFQADAWEKPSFFKLDGMCLEERVFYRAISGLHTSINIHLCSNYLLSDPNKPSLIQPGGEWGMNFKEFEKRFSPTTTKGQGPNWLRNLYFLYLLELRAIEKVSPSLEKEEFYTGNQKDDWDTQMAIKDLIKTIKQFPSHFDESTMFIGDANKKKLKNEFRDHFRNVSRIMDCVGCDKCKLWGKLQTQGLGTALKILFSTDDRTVENFKLLRNEIVSLLNAFGRLSNSIYKLDDFRESLKG